MEPFGLIQGDKELSFSCEPFSHQHNLVSGLRLRLPSFEYDKNDKKSCPKSDIAEIKTLVLTGQNAVTRDGAVRVILYTH